MVSVTGRMAGAERTDIYKQNAADARKRFYSVSTAHRLLHQALGISENLKLEQTTFSHPRSQPNLILLCHQASRMILISVSPLFPSI